MAKKSNQWPKKVSGGHDQTRHRLKLQDAGLFVDPSQVYVGTSPDPAVSSDSCCGTGINSGGEVP